MSDGAGHGGSDGGGGGSARVVYAALGINLVIAAMKLVAAALSRSTAMLAEALHSLADTSNQIFLLIGMRSAVRPADDDHPFGYGPERYFWSFMAALSIFTVGGALSIYEGGRVVWAAMSVPGHEAHEGGNPLWALAVLGGSMVLEGSSFAVAVREFKRESAGRGIRATLREARDPTVITVLFEDLAALVGLVLATGGVVASMLTGSAVYDGAASILVGAVLIAVASVLARDTKSLLIGQSVPERERDRIAQIAAAATDVTEVIHIRTVHLGPRDVMVGLKLRFAPTIDMPTLEARINQLEAALRAELPHLRLIYVEPGFREHR